MKGLTAEDVNVLIEAVDAWASEPELKAMFSGLIGGALLSGVMGKEGASAFANDVLSGGRSESQERKVQAEEMKTKLIGLQDKLLIEEVGRSIGGKDA